MLYYPFDDAKVRHFLCVRKHFEQQSVISTLFLTQVKFLPLYTTRHLYSKRTQVVEVRAEGPKTLSPEGVLHESICLGLSVYRLAAVKSSPCTAASPSNMTSTKAQDE